MERLDFTKSFLFCVAISLIISPYALAKAAPAIAPAFDAAQTNTVLSISLVDQFIVGFSGLFIKPMYMTLSVLLILFLRGIKSRDIVLLRWSIILFLLGEAFCAVNYIFFSGVSDLFEILHGLGMVGLGVLLPWGMFELFDERILRVTDQNHRCAFQKMCRICWKYEDVSCGLHRLFRYLAPAFAIIALLPLTAPLRPFHIVLPVFGSKAIFQFSFIVLIFEIRIYPILAFVFMFSSIFYLRGGPSEIKKAQPLFFAGLGFWLYSLFRFIMVTGYYGLPQWMNFWEELIELITIIGMGFFFIIFRRQLGLKTFPKPFFKK